MFLVGKRGKVYDKFGNLRDDVEDDSLFGFLGEYSEQIVDGVFLVSSDRKGFLYFDKYQKVFGVNFVCVFFLLFFYFNKFIFCCICNSYFDIFFVCDFLV